MVNWANLPYNLLQAVLDKLYDHKDYAIFSSICRDWRSAWKQYYRTLPPIPKFLFKIRDLYKVRVPGKECWHGLSYGWLGYWHNETRSITLVNADAQEITTPPLIFSPMSRPQYNIYKAILTADPKQNPHDFALVVIYSAFRRVAYYKPSLKTWICFNFRWELNGVLDIILHRGLVFAISKRSSIIAFDHNSTTPGTYLQVASPEKTHANQFFVETSRGELLLVLNQFNKQVGTPGFKLYKLILDERTNKLVAKHELISLGTDAVFYSCKNTFCVPVKEHNDCQPNSIYFSIADDPDDDWMDPWMSIAIFNLSRKDTRVLYRGLRLRGEARSTIAQVNQKRRGSRSIAHLINQKPKRQKQDHEIRV